MKILLRLLSLTSLAACAPANFPTGTFSMAFTVQSNTCAFDLKTDPQSITIDVDDSGGYTVTFLGGQLTPVSANSAHLTFITAPTHTQQSGTGAVACDFTETDTFTLTAAGRNFAGTVQQTLSSNTANSACASCAIVQGLNGTWLSN